MKISELIKKLEGALEQNGDLPAIYYTYNNSATQINEVVEVYTAKEDEQVLVLAN